jgi:hypothetical protein
VNEDSARILRDPDFHDGHLMGIRVIDRSTLELFCSTIDGESYLVSLSELECLRADNFLQGNIVFEVTLFDSAFPVDLVKRAFGLDGDEQPAWLDGKIEQMGQGHWTLLQLSSSYGCDLLAIGKGTIRVEKV